MNICDYIRKHNLPHTIDEFGRVVQNGDLYLNDNKITSLDGFVQNGFLDLSYNQITTLKGFVQNGYLDLSYNQILNSKTS